jgi:hypothetical protein
MDCLPVVVSDLDDSQNHPASIEVQIAVAEMSIDLWWTLKIAAQRRRPVLRLQQ